MPLTDEQLATIEALAQNEDAIGDLYKVYSSKFPAYKTYWDRMVDEERGHAIWLRSLVTTIKDDDRISFDKSSFNPDVINRSISHINRLEKEAREIDLDIMSAASHALVIENSLLEKKFFEIFSGDSVELKRIMINLANAAKNHRDRVARFIEDLKKEGGSKSN